MIYIAALKVSESVEIAIEPLQLGQVLTKVAQLAALKWDEPPTIISAKNTIYIDLFLFDLAIELLENTGINKHVIKLVYQFIYFCS